MSIGTSEGDGRGPGGGPRSPDAAAEPGTKKTAWIVGGVLALLILVGAGVLLSGVLDGDESSEGEVFLAPAADLGPDPYSDIPLAETPDPALAQPVSQTGASIDGSGQVASDNGGTPGLYGGTLNTAACDPQQITDFLAANPDKAVAWVAALNADPEVSLADGRPLTVETIPDYMATLTPVVLVKDTRVTNHGYRDGRPTSLQSVLQKGSAVLVDAKGVPRVKCYCGNPLLPPTPTTTKPVYTGAMWPDFRANTVNVVQQSTTVINVFVLTDYTTGKLFDRPAGSTGAFDTPNSPGTATTAPPVTTAPPTTAAPTTAAPTTPPTTAAPTTVPAPNCSRESSQSTGMTIVNNRSTPVEIIFVNPNCGEESITSVGPGQTIPLNTFIGHSFVAKSGGNTVSTFDVTSADPTWTIG